MSFIRPASMRLTAAPRAVMRPRVTPKRITAPAFRRTFATEVPPAQPTTQTPPPSSGGGGGSNAPMLIVLAAILGVGAGGYYYLKPVRDVAAIAHSGITSAKENAESLSGLTDYAKGFLPPGAFALYQALSSQPGGAGGFLASLKDKDLNDVLDEVKKHGGDDIKKVVEKVQKKVQESKGDISKIDWKSLASELKDDLPEGSQKMIETLIGKIPDKADFDALIKKAKDIGQDQLKQVEDSASKILKEVEKARKEGKDTADAFLKGLKEAAPADVDSLINQLKETAKKAGLPADTAEAWLKSKAKDGKVDAEALAKQVESRLKDAAKFIPGEPKDLIKQVDQLSPSLAKLLQQALQQADIVDEKGNRK
ncbi:uncharacterized protein IL334_004696 [Kwoniella shivajii]|uniref:Uncharacterized protein n=1 Tax=Kwoniella shivajii TaxID=564305 RepID=A0ABZ1D2G4_9TREE|nr:hypothetical protein IL334_004696 [Kwoniella shivajii]